MNASDRFCRKIFPYKPLPLEEFFDKVEELKKCLKKRPKKFSHEDWKAKGKKINEEIFPLYVFLKNLPMPDNIKTVLIKDKPDAILTTDKGKEIKIEITSGLGDGELRLEQAKHLDKHCTVPVNCSKQELKEKNKHEERAQREFCLEKEVIIQMICNALCAIRAKADKNASYYEGAILLVVINTFCEPNLDRVFNDLQKWRVIFKKSKFSKIYLVDHPLKCVKELHSANTLY